MSISILILFIDDCVSSFLFDLFSSFGTGLGWVGLDGIGWGLGYGLELATMENYLGRIRIASSWIG